VLNATVIVIAIALAWHVASRQTTSAGDLAAEAQTLFSAVNLLVASVLAWITGFYAVKASALARDTTRLADETRRAVEAELMQATAVTEQSRAAMRQADLTEQALHGTHRPVIIDLDAFAESSQHDTYVMLGAEPVRCRQGVVVLQARPGMLWVSIPFRNVGNGLATIVGLRLEARHAT
jgi:hypothetical protein